MMDFIPAVSHVHINKNKKVIHARKQNISQLHRKASKG